MKPEYNYPTKEFILTQPWGTYHPEIYSQFGFTNHNGIDMALGKDKLWRYPWNGTGKVVRMGNQPNGGGIFLGILSDDVFDFPDGKQARILTDALHAEKLLFKEGDSVKTGDPCIVQDNTGFSTGPHTHEQCRRTDPNGTLNTIDVNNANNSFNQLDYATGGYAYQLQEISLLKKVVELYKKLFKKLNYIYL